MMELAGIHKQIGALPKAPMSSSNCAAFCFRLQPRSRARLAFSKGATNLAGIRFSVLQRLRGFALFVSALEIASPPEAWAVRKHQPLCINALEAVAKYCGDPDAFLFPSLKAGVSTG